MKRFGSVFMAALTLLVGSGAMLGAGNKLANASDGPVRVSAVAHAKAAGIRTVRLAVDGMTCSGCERHVTSVLKKVDGYAGSRLSYKTGEAVIDYDPMKTSAEQLAEAITVQAGFKAMVPKARRTHR